MNQGNFQNADQAARSIYVGNIAWKTTEQEIGDTFANFGYVNSVKIITDKDSGKSKGFGFVEFQDPTIIPMVIQQMNGYNLNGRSLRVNMAAGVKPNQNMGGNQMNGGNRGGNMGPGGPRGGPGGQFGGQMRQQGGMGGPGMGQPQMNGYRQEQGMGGPQMGGPQMGGQPGQGMGGQGMGGFQ